MKYSINKKIIDNKNYVEDFLLARGIIDINSYISPNRTLQLNPFALKNMEQGINLLLKHITNNNRIHIIVDCDGDGVTSAAELYLYLKKLYPYINITWSMHDGKQHGIELNKIPLDIDLLIVPDAGSSQYFEHKELYDIGIDVLVLDHHETEKESEYAVIINNQIGNYPNKTLTGAGVVYKFLTAFDIITGNSIAEDYIDLAAVGIIGDMADIRDLETRYIIKEGLTNIKNFGLKTFIDKQSFSIGDISKLSPTAISFYITPLINAIIRVGTMDEKELLFRAFIDGNELEKSTKRGAKNGDTEIVAEKAARIATNCRSRQNKILDASVDFVRFYIEKNSLVDNKILLITLNEEECENVPSELTGLVAMKISQEYQKPTLITKISNDGFYKGSGRGLNNSELDDLKKFLNDSGYFEYAEGHPLAHGVSISNKLIDTFTKYANKKLEDFDFGQNYYEVDYYFNARTDDFFNLSKCIIDLDSISALYGKGVEEPKILIDKIPLKYCDVSIIGKTLDTVKIIYDGIIFLKFKDKKMAELNFNNNLSINIIGKPSVNEWMGRRSPQIFIDDYELIDDRKSF